MSEAQLVMVMVGLAINLVVMIVGGLGLAFKVWRWIGGLAERIASVETNIVHLQSERGGGRGNLRSAKR